MDTQSRKINAGRGAGHPLSSVLGNNAAALQPLLSTPCLAFWGLAPPSRILAYEINTINAVALKLPELWQSKVRSWFAQAEAKFVTSGVTMSLTKYYHVIKALQESSIERIPELLVPPADDPYSVLKLRLREKMFPFS